MDELGIKDVLQEEEEKGEEGSLLPSTFKDKPVKLVEIWSRNIDDSLFDVWYSVVYHRVLCACATCTKCIHTCTHAQGAVSSSQQHHRGSYFEAGGSLGDSQPAVTSYSE